MAVTVYLLVSLICCIFFNYLYKRRKLYCLAMKLDGPVTLPLIGSAHYLIGGRKKAAENIVFLMKKYKSPWKMWLGNWLVVILTKPEDLEIIMNQSLEKSTVYKFVKPILREGLFTGPVSKWKWHRKTIMTTFNMQILNSFVAIFAEHSHKLVPNLEKLVDKGYFDVFPILAHCALEITCETAMGGNSNQRQENINFVKYFGRAMELVYWRMLNYWFHPDFIWRLTPYSKELDDLTIKIQTFVRAIVTQKRREFYATKSLQECIINSQEFKRKKCFLDHLIQLSEDGENWTDEELMEEAQTMVAAGSESIGFVESYVLLMLGMHPQIQQRVHEELHNIYKNDLRPVTPDDLSQMPYLDRVIKETLRLFPVSAGLGRRVDKDIVTSSYVIPEGCECFIATLYVHRNPELWPEPLTFDPDRFLPEMVEKRHPYAYIPFSRGPRNCIGYKYAMMVVKTTVATIVRHFEIKTDFEKITDIELIPGVLLKPTRGHRIALQLRNKNR